MSLMSQLSRSAQQVQQSFHLPAWTHLQCSSAAHGGGVVLTVVVLSVAAAAMLVLAP